MTEVLNGGVSHWRRRDVLVYAKHIAEDHEGVIPTEPVGGLVLITCATCQDILREGHAEARKHAAENRAIIERVRVRP